MPQAKCCKKIVLNKYKMDHDFSLIGFLKFAINQGSQWELKLIISEISSHHNQGWLMEFSRQIGLFVKGVHHAGKFYINIAGWLGITCYWSETIFVISLKRNAQFLSLCDPQKSGFWWVCISFPQITRNILTKDIFYWLELITEILSFLQIFSVLKATTQLFSISENLQENNRTYISDIFWSFETKLFMLTIKIPERCHWRRRSFIFIVNFEHISHLVLVFLLLTLSR